MLKKITVLAMALGALAAFALPSTAGAAWRHAQQGPIAQNTQIELTGTEVRFQSAIGGVKCQTISKVQFTAGTTTGHAETFAPHPTSDTANCQGTGGLAFCQIHNLQPTALPWGIHTVTEGALNKIQITVGEIHSQATDSFCPVISITLTGGTITADPEQEPVQTLKLHGKLPSHITTKDLTSHTTEVDVLGQLHVLGAANGTYRI